MGNSLEGRIGECVKDDRSEARIRECIEGDSRIRDFADSFRDVSL